MTDSASQSLVERLPELPDDHSDLTPELALMVVGKYRELMSQQAARITELEAERGRLRKYCSAAAHDYGSLLTTLESSIGPPFLESFKETRNELRESSEFMRLAAEGRENGLLYDDELSAAKQRALAAESELSRAEVERNEFRSALKGLSDMYGSTWDRVDGALMMMDSGIKRFEKAHAIAYKILQRLPASPLRNPSTRQTQRERE